MSEEKKKILEMLSEGKITVDDAEKLLSKVGGSRAENIDEPAAVHVSDQPARNDSGSDRPLRFLRVVVDSEDGDKVNVRVPLALIRTGIKLTAMLPSGASSKLSEQGIDLAHLGALEGDELIEALRDLTVDVDSSDGDKVRVFCE